MRRGSRAVDAGREPALRHREVVAVAVARASSGRSRTRRRGGTAPSPAPARAPARRSARTACRWPESQSHVPGTSLQARDERDARAPHGRRRGGRAARSTASRRTSLTTAAAARSKGDRCARVQSSPWPRSSTRRRARRARNRCLRTFAHAGRSSSPAARSRRLARRIGSVAALLVLDLCGLALGVYAALALREIVTGSRPILWGLIWRDAEANWLPFLALVLVLVFWQKGLYAEREHRGGIGQIVSALVVVAVARARVRRRHRLPLLDLRDLPDGARAHDGADRNAPRELRHRHEGHLPPDGTEASRGARRHGRQRRAPAREPRPRTRRRRVPVPRRDRPGAGRRRPAGARQPRRACRACSRRTTSTS